MTRQLDLAVLRAQGIDFRVVGANPNNYGYPRGATHQCDPHAVVWHITASKVSPGPNPLAGLDSWFNNPDAVACAQLGISGVHVHEYVPWHVAPYQAGYVARPDVGNPIIADWVARRQNPNFLSYGIEVVAEPSGARVAAGVHLVSADTWRSMLLVDEQLHLQLGIPRTLHAHMGHGQIDGVNRTRDPFNVYLPSDIFAAHAGAASAPAPPIEEEEDDMTQLIGHWAAEVPHRISFAVTVGKEGARKTEVKGDAEYQSMLAAGFPVVKKNASTLRKIISTPGTPQEP